MPDLRGLARKFGQTARLMIGVPDYDAYTSLTRAKHPERPVMTEAEFFRDSQDRRYGGGKGRPVCRCC